MPDAAQLRTVLWGQLNDRHKVSANLLRDDDVRTVEDEGRQFVVVNVPRASRLQRPVFVGPDPMTGTYRRADEGDYRCSDDEVLVRDGLLIQQNQRRWASYRVAEDSPQSDDGSPHLEADSPPSPPPIGGGLPSFDDELPSFTPGTPVNGGAGPPQRQAACS